MSSPASVEMIFKFLMSSRVRTYSIMFSGMPESPNPLSDKCQNPLYEKKWLMKIYPTMIVFPALQSRRASSTVSHSSKAVECALFAISVLVYGCSVVDVGI